MVALMNGRVGVAIVIILSTGFLTIHRIHRFLVDPNFHDPYSTSKDCSQYTAEYRQIPFHSESHVRNNCAARDGYETAASWSSVLQLCNREL